MRSTIFALLLMLPRASGAEENAVEAEHTWNPPHRVYFNVAGFAGATSQNGDGFGYRGQNLPSVIGGLVGTAGAELGLKSGVTLGFEVAPITWVSGMSRPSIDARLALGYARQMIAIALEVGSTLTWLYPQLGAVVRVGRLDGTWARLRISWAVYPPTSLPSDVSLEISTPVTRRLRTVIDLGGQYGNTTGAWATVGLSYLSGGSRNLRGGALTVGLGVGWLGWAIGPMVSIGYERRL